MNPSNRPNQTKYFSFYQIDIFLAKKGFYPSLLCVCDRPEPCVQVEVLPVVHAAQAGEVSAVCLREKKRNEDGFFLIFSPANITLKKLKSSKKAKINVRFLNTISTVKSYVVEIKLVDGALAPVGKVGVPAQKRTKQFN